MLVTRGKRLGFFPVLSEGPYNGFYCPETKVRKGPHNGFYCPETKVRKGPHNEFYYPETKVRKGRGGC